MNRDDLKGIKEILERIKDETLVTVDSGAYDLVNVNNEGVNFGVMQMFYKLLLEVYRAENELIRKEMSA